jgi:hypothetical protein
VTPPIRPPTPEQVARLLAAADEYDPGTVKALEEPTAEPVP